MERRIIHIDMDAFFAQVEQNDNPNLRGKPVIVGGRSYNRGVVATASYEARKFGVHSAMPTKTAHKLCPDGVFVHPRFERYKEISEQIRKIFLSYTDDIEPLSLDEAYLDITELVNKTQSARTIALKVQSEIFEKTGLTSSSGISYNKYLAKIASGMNKPKGTTVIDYSNVLEILFSMPIGKFPGVGKVTEEKMHELGIKTGKDLYDKTKNELILIFGKRGESLYNKARGIGTNKLTIQRERKSIGKETTFNYDRNDDTEILSVLETLSEKVSTRLQDKGVVAKVITVKIKTANFETHTRQMMTVDPVSSGDDIYHYAYNLYHEVKEADVPIRLIGVTASNLSERLYRNMTIYDFIL